MRSEFQSEDISSACDLKTRTFSIDTEIDGSRLDRPIQVCYVAFDARGLLRSGPLASDDELPKFAGSFALKSIEFLDMARGDLDESLQKSIEDFQGTFDHDPYAAIVKIFDQPTDRVLSSKVADGVAHADSLNTPAEETGQSLHGSPPENETSRQTIVCRLR
jgi:hypothetical protein